MQIDIIGVPIDLGADRRGVDMGPSAIRYSHLQRKLEELGYIVQDEGNVDVPIAEMCKITNPNLKYIDCIIPMSRRVWAVSTSMQAGHFPLVIGGDHSYHWIGARCGARNRKLGVIGLMRTPISTLLKPHPREIFMACRLPFSADLVIKVWCNCGMKPSL